MLGEVAGHQLLEHGLCGPALTDRQNTGPLPNAWLVDRPLDWQQPEPGAPALGSSCLGAMVSTFHAGAFVRCLAALLAGYLSGCHARRPTIPHDSIHEVRIWRWAEN